MSLFVRRGIEVTLSAPPEAPEPETPSGALAISVQPEDLVTAVGDDGVFDITITGGVGPFTYKWQGYTTSTSTWTNLQDIVSEARTSTFTYPGFPPAGALRQIRCVVTDSTTPTPATVTSTTADWNITIDGEDPDPPVEPDPISVVGSDIAVSALGSPTSLTVTIPTVLDDDVAVLIIQSFNGTDQGLPTSGLTGWTLEANYGGGSFVYRTMVWTKVLTAADSAVNVTPVFSAANGWSLMLLVARSVDTTDILDAITASHTTAVASTTAAWPTLTTVTDEALVVAAVSAKDPMTGFPTPTGFTEVQDGSGTNQFRNGALSYKTTTTAGVHTPAAITLPSSTDSATIALALKPLSTGGGGDPEPPPPPPPPSGSTNTFWAFSDFAYPTAPTNGSIVNGATVVWVTNRSTLNAALGSNKFIVLQDGNYQDGTRLNIGSMTNLTLMAQNKYGASFAWSSSANQTNNCIHFGRCNGVTLRGLDFRYSGYYAVRFGIDAVNFPSDPSGACSNVLIEHCRVRDGAMGAFKFDNGGISTYGISQNIEVRYNHVYAIGQNPAFPDFCEAVYLGSGDSLCHVNRVQNVNIHHNIFDGTNTGSTFSGEAVEAKVYCMDVTIADNLILNWQLGDSTSGGAIALSVNSGANLTGGIMPSSGTRGKLSYLVERNRIYNTRVRSGTIYSKGHAITVGHGNTTIRNNIIWDTHNGAIRFIQKNTSDSGIFYNPDQLDVDILHNTFLGNSGTYTVDAQDVPTNKYARVRSINNVSNETFAYPTSGITWLTKQDQGNASASSFVGNTFTGLNNVASNGEGSGFRPINDSTLVTGVDAGVTNDVLGNARPTGNRQYGAFEA